MSFERSRQAKGDVPEALANATTLRRCWKSETSIDYLLHRGTSTRRVVVSNRLLTIGALALSMQLSLPEQG